MIDYDNLNQLAVRKLAAEKGKSRGMKTTPIRTVWSREQCIDFLLNDTVPATAAPVMESVATISTDVTILTDVAADVPVHVPDGLKMEFSTFARKTDNKAKPLILDKQAFFNLLAKRSVRAEKDGKLFSPVKFAGTRTKDAFISASGVGFDFEGGKPNIESVLELFPPGTLVAYHSTHSHTPENPRFRVITPLSRPVNADEHARLVLGIKSIITPELTECLDATCFERARAHYLPSCPPERECHAFAGHQDGDPLDVDHFLSLGDAVAAAAISPIERREAPAPEDAQHPATIPTTSSTYEFTDPATGEVFNLVAWAAQNPTFDIIAAVDHQHSRGNLKEDGKQHLACPFEGQHTDQGKDLATYAANASPPRYNAWDIHCCHAHCVGRDRLEFILAMLEQGWLSVDQLQAAAPAPIEIRRPPNIYFPVNDILTAPEWATLRPAEKRIALDLMAMAWAENDGMIDDNDWMIARRLDISETDWMSHRETLNRTGWLITYEGRLKNTIVKRQFDKAQVAYMKGIAKSKKGGEATQEKARLKLL